MGLKIVKFETLKAAQNSVMVPEAGYSAVRHELKDGEEVPVHVEEVDEWIFINQGKFVLTVGKSYVDFDLKGEEWLVLCLPAGVEHALRAETDLSYFVLKEVKKK